MNKTAAVLQWTARILCILAMLFMGLFSLDAFAPGIPLLKQIAGFLMHNIPVFVLLAALILAWKRELMGGVVFILLGLVLSILVFNINHGRNQFSLVASIRNAAMIAVPVILVGILFIWSHFLKAKSTAAHS